jgi:hypothetical protein
MKTPLLAFIFVLSGGDKAWASLGETEDQLIAHYGSEIAIASLEGPQEKPRLLFHVKSKELMETEKEAAASR